MGCLEQNGLLILKRIWKNDIFNSNIIFGSFGCQSWVVLSKTKYSRVVFWWKIQPEKTVPNRMNRIKEIHNFFLNFMTFSFYRISLPSGILEIIVRLVLNRKISETISDMISAVRKAHHTAWSPPNFASKPGRRLRRKDGTVWDNGTANKIKN